MISFFWKEGCMGWNASVVFLWVIKSLTNRITNKLTYNAIYWNEMQKILWLIYIDCTWLLDVLCSRVTPYKIHEAWGFTKYPRQEYFARVQILLSPPIWTNVVSCVFSHLRVDIRHAQAWDDLTMSKFKRQWEKAKNLMVTVIFQLYNEVSELSPS